jgi:hypothetical protein
MSHEFKRGDRVVYPAGIAPDAVRRVLAVHEDWVWTLREGLEGTEPIGIRADALKLAPAPFFEEGKTYIRWADWSIWGQVRGAVEEFTVLKVATNSSGSRVAFGAVRVGGGSVKQHVTVGEHHWKTEGWKEAE